MISSRTAAAAVALLCALAGLREARAWTPTGHEAIEAAAYRRLVAREHVGAAGISGREVLRRLIRRGVLSAPRCFEPEQGSDDAETCSPGRTDAPLDWWPVLGSGSPDLLFSRHLGHQGQCFHFMADAGDAHGRADPRHGVPRALAVDAYARCIKTLHTLGEELLEDPVAARHRGRGAYALIHAVGDAWSPAHVERAEGVGHIHHLKAWVVRDWLRWLLDRMRYSPRLQHATVDERDEAWLREDARTGGRSCDGFPHPYALPEECLTPPARRAVDAVEDLLILLEQVGPEAAGGARRSLDDPEAAVAWKLWLAEYFVSAFDEAPSFQVELVDREWRPSVMAGLRVAGVGESTEVSLLGGVLPFKRFLLPFIAAPTLTVGWRRVDDESQLHAAADFGLLMPLFERVSIGGTPVAAELICDLDGGCEAELLGAPIQLWYFHDSGLWASLGGPRWSWLEREFRSPTLTFSVGWSWDVELSSGPPPRAFGTAAWDPPPLPASGYPRGAFVRALLLESSVLSTTSRHHVGLTAEARWNRSQWDRKKAFTYGVSLGMIHGVEGGQTWDEAILSPIVRYWLVPHVVALSAEPAVLGAGWTDEGVSYDVGGRVGLALVVGRIELAVLGPRLSYLDEDRRAFRPLGVRIGFLLD